jgi:hypothetical protein
MSKKEDEVKVPFSITVEGSPLSVYISGSISAEVLNSSSLGSAEVRNFIENSAECRDYLKAWNCSNLMKIREVLLAFIRSVFAAYSVEVLKIRWLNGGDSLDIG